MLGLKMLGKKIIMIYFIWTNGTSMNITRENYSWTNVSNTLDHLIFVDLVITCKILTCIITFVDW